ncbi:CHASE2 domain-containing sensor protein [Maribacter vaceletii]|uniref:CHASE2 domain-containing sensor protein n=1 Tax=Maribacter vaceletii TaxID=1206816 RepID=A0A495ECQ5_9FLAO|nr:CHASE2 domain-containing protein [Maribacter vaceletii]RKR14652.1 CHASE2 domain-containing sensor protein [Maribacter vaceletii]
MKKVFVKLNKVLFKEAFFCMLFSFLILGVIALIGLNISFFSPFEDAFKDFSYLDLYYTEKLEEKEEHVNENIFLVNVDKINRKEISLLLKAVAEQKPKVIGVDVIFKELKDPVLDNFLSESLQKKNVVTTYAFTNSGIDLSNEFIRNENATEGYTNFSFTSKSSVIRSFQGIKKENDTTYLSFGLAVAKKFYGNNWNSSIEKQLYTERTINYEANRDGFFVLEYKDLMNQESISILKDKIVLLGYLGDAKTHFLDLEDKHFTPMNKKFVGKSSPDTFGIVIHANIINMLITNNFINEVPNWVVMLVTLLLSYLALSYFIWLNKKQLASYILRLNILRIIFVIFFIWFSLLLFKNQILLKTAPIIAVVVFSVSLIGYYKKLVHYLNKKFKWKGYFYQD